MSIANFRKITRMSLTFALLLVVAFCSSNEDKISSEENAGGPLGETRL